MCRLAAMTCENKSDLTRLLVWSNLLWVSHLDGNEHGTGCLVAGKKTSIIKTGENAAHFVFSDAYLEFLDKFAKSATTFVGHTRLASKDFRVADNQQYPDWAAHPFDIGSDTYLFHNGIFSEYERIGKEYNLEGDFTDTMAFAAILRGTTNNGENLNFDTITEALGLAGRCEYSMLITKGSDLYAVHGVRPLFFAQTSIGLLINTTKGCIENAVERANHVLALQKMVRVTKDEPKAFDDWSISLFHSGEMVDSKSIMEIKKINDTPVIVDWPRGKNATRGTDRSASNAVLVVDNGSIVPIYQGALAFYELTEILPTDVTDLGATRILREMISDKIKSWTEIAAEDIHTVVEILQWYWRENPEEAPSEDKLDLWIKVSAQLLKYPGDVYEAAKKFDPNFEFPYFHNTVEQLERLVEALGKK